MNKRSPFHCSRAIGIMMLLWCSQACQLQAQPLNIAFDHLSTENGLSHNAVRAILEDRKGFMWFGTADGLNKYDGYSFTTYKNNLDNPKSLSHSFIYTLYEDADGFLWVGTDGGFNKFNPITETATRYVHDPKNPNSLSHNAVYAVCIDREGIFWLATDGGLNRFDPRTEQFIRYQHDPNDPNSLSQNILRAVYEDRSGTLWIGSLNGLNKFDRATGQFTHYQNDPADPNSLSHNDVRGILEDASGILWISTNGGGLNAFDRATGRFTRYQNDPANPQSLSNNILRGLYQDQDGILWIATDKGGVNLFDRATGHFTSYLPIPNDPNSLSDNVVTTIYEDRNNTIWLGTFKKGVNLYNPLAKKFTRYTFNSDDPKQFSDNFISAIYEDPAGNVWFGTDGGGLKKFDRRQGSVTHYRNNPADPATINDNVVLVIRADAAGMLWLGGYLGGVSRCDPNTGQCTHYQHQADNLNSLSHDFIRAIYPDPSGVIWIGTNGGGLDKLDPATGQFTHYRSDPNNPKTLSNDRVMTIYRDPSGELWLGMYGGGLNHFRPATGDVTRYLHQSDQTNSLSNNDVWYIHQDRQHPNLLWLGTSGGLNQFDRTAETFRYYTENDGLPNNVVYAMLEDRAGNLWMSTNKGISMFQPATERFKNYDVRDGLQDNVFTLGASYQSDSGEMFFGGNKGLNAFYPDKLRDNPQIPPIALTSLTQGGDALIQGKSPDNATEFSLDWQHNFFEFEFAALNYLLPEKNQYAYWLDGLDKTWNMMGTRRYGKYTNLPGGAYTLRIKGSNNDGVWNEQGIALAIHVGSPFWKTWWFYLICGVSLVGTLQLIYVSRTRQLTRFNQRLTQKVEERTTELTAANLNLEQASREIAALNECLKTENVRMSAELDVTRRLQQMILPGDQELKQIEGVDIVGFMAPATEVGGDYYDVLRSSNGINIGIGDVTGHGLESGVLMLMTQTAIRALLFSGETNPVKFLSALNRTLYMNIQRMQVDKSLTLALVNYQNGQLKLIGQHEQMILVRRDGQIELVDTIDLGFPIGLEEDIEKFVNEKTVFLHQGDGLVLYSDGITEAENPQKRYYGLERLCDVLRRSWDQPAEQIKQAVVEDVYRFIGTQTVFDDLTLVILKQQ